jgi:urea transport system substrate-binding protein
MSDEFPEPAPTVRIKPKPSPSMSGETASEGAAGHADTGFSLKDTSFLAPATSPDELGWLAHYRVLRLLGRGGMGTVFLAEDTHLQRPVALKVIVPEYAGNLVARERFLREARASAALKNDHIITIYQVGQDRDVPFLAMEFLEGETLDMRLIRGGALPAGEVLRIAREVTDGLAAAHAHGLIHRDVKPANIWLEAPGGRVKILDFGLARAAGTRSGLTATGDVMGTPDYMSPEQARGKDLDARTDLFSLGAVLYAMASGQKPFPGDSVMAVLTALAVDTPRPICELKPDVPPALAQLIERLLAKDPANRPESAAEVAQTLAAIEPGTPAPTAVNPRLVTQVGIPSPTLHATAPVPPARRRPRWLGPALALGGLALLAGVAFLAGWFGPRPEGNAGAPAAPSGPPIRIGVLHSQTGTMGLSERPVIDAVQLAVEELNERGGVLGRPVEAVLANGQSDEEIFASEAEKLIVQEKVCTLFGCWTSASRKAVVPVVERHDHLLFYPVQYEGVEQSPNVVYLGPVPNQQIIPALSWLVGFENKRRWFLVGSDYVYPVTANAVVRAEAKARGCEVVGESYLVLGSGEVGEVVKQIVKARPDLIVNTVNGDTNVALFRALRRAGIKAKGTPTLSTSISEEELSALGPRDIAGDYVAANYFQSLDTPANRTFVARFHKRYNADRVISSAAETAYAGVHLWAQAVKAAGRAEVRAIRAAIKGQTYDAPQGLVQIDPATLHAVQVARVGRVDAAGRLVEVYASPQPIVPEPFPGVHSRAEWQTFLDGLHKRWGGRWSNLGP